ncbi:PA2778 family cysteine peptidase [Marinobacter sp.]|uniref:PA2778 family cysteine peptidase n=1 Tax=Marinobacter sp. TaxID=50741 RepID=UPI001983928B|nr:PA2778 family cysteine peptidase [Marinobacter sp.]MBC7191474.1 PA2778 family cysteine peptidase [Marinobacter sp.]
MNRRTSRRIAAITISLLLAVMLSGCASRPPWPAAAEQSGLDLEQRVILDQVPFYAQELYQCGPASLAMMLNAQGLSTRPEQLKDLVYIPEREGSLQVELVAAGRSHGMVVYQLDGSLRSLLSEVAAGHPVMVMQNLRFSWWPQWHFAVVTGFDRQKRNVILNTDTRERHEEAVEVFMATWGRANNWAVVMLPPTQLPATADPIDYLMAVNDLETTAHIKTARQAYSTAENAWPDQPAAILGQGNIAWRAGNWPEATRHYLRLTTRFPGLAAGWNNLAQSLAKQGCEPAAQTAAWCAHGLKPDRFSPDLPDMPASVAAECPSVTCPLPD